MSFALTQTIIDLLGIPLPSKAVLIVLARHARDDGTNPKCPSVGTIADKAGMSDKCARNALRWLEADGWIEAIGRKVGGRALATNYVILVDRLGPRETRNDIPPKNRETRNRVPPNGHDTRNEEAPFRAETRNDVPLNPERRSAEYVTEYVKEEGMSCVTSESSACVPAREADTTAPSGLVLPFIKAGGDRSPMLVNWVPSIEWRRWGVAAGHRDIDAGSAAFRAIWLKRQIQGVAGPPKTEREWWVLFSGWILGDIKQGRYNGQHHKVSGSGSDRSEAIHAGAALALAAVERMEAGRRSAG